MKTLMSSTALATGTVSVLKPKPPIQYLYEWVGESILVIIPWHRLYCSNGQLGR